MNNDYTPYGPEWEKEVSKLPKKVLVDMLRKAHLSRQAFADCLEELMCWQNGIPLPTYAKGWTAAMQRGEALLNGEENTQPQQ